MSKFANPIVIAENELHFNYIQSAGPGGQNVNKVATAVQLRFDIHNSPSLTDSIKKRLSQIAGKRITQDGIFIITAQRYRTQEQNKEDALRRLQEWIDKASHVSPSRRKTRPTRASQLKRLKTKNLHSQKKRLRKEPDKDE